MVRIEHAVIKNRCVN